MNPENKNNLPPSEEAPPEYTRWRLPTANRKTIIIVAAIFIASYLVSFGIWYLVKDYYGVAINYVASHSVGAVKDVEVYRISRNGDRVTVNFVSSKTAKQPKIQTDIQIPKSNYAFNVPLTLAIMAAFFPFLRRKWIYLEVVLVLIAVHVLFVFSLQGERLTAVLTIHGYEKQSDFAQIFWEFLWGFVDNMVVRFEPFLIGAYLFFFRNRVPKKKKRSPGSSKKKRRSRSRGK